MGYIISISCIALVLITISVVRNYKLKVNTTTFSNLSKIHSNWHNDTIKKVNNNLLKLPKISEKELIKYLKVLRKNTNLVTTYDCNDTVDDTGFINYLVTLKNNCDDFLIEMKLSYITNDDIVHYNPNKSNTEFISGMKMYWFNYSLSYVNSDDITVKSFIYVKLNNNNYIEIPMKIRVKIYPYEIKTKQGIMNYSIEV